MDANQVMCLEPLAVADQHAISYGILPNCIIISNISQVKRIVEDNEHIYLWYENSHYTLFERIYMWSVDSLQQRYVLVMRPTWYVAHGVAVHYTKCIVRYHAF